MPPSRKGTRVPSKPRQPQQRRPGRQCGLCGNTGPLTQTECCGAWVCDDADSYVLFSFARNSCARNHQRFTLCGYHSAEGHPGSWQSCSKCRQDFETEMYVYYGTNEYNFEVLANPPAFRPTLCDKCGARISLGYDSYSSLGARYTCAKCTPGMGSPSLRSRSGPKRRK